MPSYNELVTKFSFEGSTAPLANFNDLVDDSSQALAVQELSLQDVGKALLDFKGTLASVASILTGGIIVAWANSISEAVDPIVQLSRVTNESAEDIQAWGYAASQSGSDVDAVAESMKELNLRMGEFARSGGGPAAEAIKDYGLNVRNSNGDIKSASELFSDLNAQMQGMSNAKRLDLLDKMGIDKSLVQLLSSTNEQVDGLRQKALALGVVTTEQGDQFAAYNDTLTTVKFGMDSISRTIAVNMMPALSELSNSFVDFLVDNQESLSKIAASAGKFFNVLVDSLKRMTPVLEIATIVMTAFWFATGGAAIAMKVLLSPITKIISVATILYLVIDDLITALDGGQSVIADFFEKYWGFDIVPVVQASKDALIEFFDYMGGIFQPLIDVARDIFSAVWSLITGDFEGFVDNILSMFENIGRFIYKVFVTHVKNAVMYVFGLWDDALGGALSDLPDKFMSVINKIGSMFSDMFSNVFSWAGEKLSALVPDFLLPDSEKATDTSVTEQEKDGVMKLVHNFFLSDSEKATDTSVTEQEKDGVMKLVHDFFLSDSEKATDTSVTEQEKDGVMKLVHDFLLPDSEKATDTSAIEQANNRFNSQTYNQSNSNSNFNTSQSNQITIYSSDPVAAGISTREQLEYSLKTARQGAGRGGM